MGQPLDDSENFQCQETKVNSGKKMRGQINKYSIWRREYGPGDTVRWEWIWD